MTNQRAIEELKCYRAKSGTEYPEEIEMAIAALEKQTPKKVINRRVCIDYGGLIEAEPYGLCPTCGTYLVYNHLYAGCPVCLQAIDWELDEPDNMI